MYVRCKLLYLGLYFYWFTERCYTEMASHLPICLSVTLRYRDHICWNSSKRTSWIVSLGCLLSQSDPRSCTYSKGKTLKFCREYGWGTEKVAFGTQYLIYLKCSKIRPLLRTNRKSHMRFLLVPKSTTMDDLEGSLCTPFQNMCVCVKALLI